MQGSKFSKTGIKAIKTSAAVLFCLLLYKALFLLSQTVPVDSSSFNMVLRFLLERENALFACVATVITMHTVFEGSIEAGMSRIWGAAIGAYFGLFLLWIDLIVLARELNILFTLLGVVSIVILCRLIKKNRCEVVALVIFLTIMLTVDQSEPFLYAAGTVIDVSVGICIALIVNALIHKPQKKPVINVNNSLTNSENHEDN